MGVNKQEHILEEVSESLNDIEGKLIETLDTDITLFSTDNENSESKMYNKIWIYENDKKFYAYNIYGDNVFLKGVHKDETKWENTNNIFRFDTINGNYVLVLEISGANLYFNDAGESIVKDSIIDKTIDKVKSIIAGIKVVSGGMSNLKEIKRNGQPGFEVKE